MGRTTLGIGIVMFALVWNTAPSTAAPIAPTRIETPPVIDGVVDEREWAGALVVSDFLQRWPSEGAAPSEKTEVLLAYTPTALYVAMRAIDTDPRGIVATVMRRDDFSITQNDQFAIAIDSYDDGRNGYWFSTNPLGVRVDAQFFDEGDIFETSWDGIWRCESRISNGGWSTELEIPFSTLRFAEGDQNVMGINLYRRLIRTNENLFAPLIPLRLANGTPNVSAARKYLFEDIKSGRRAYLRPYVAGSFERGISSEASGDAGLDLRYALTSNLTANLSLNTDFAEAEVDERQLNLTRFDLFLPEKREFFLESSGTFSFGSPGETEVFFSRRVGLTEDESGIATPVPILFGGKLTGKSHGIDLGVLDVQTRRDGSTPAENFGVFRMKAGIGARSYVGFLATTKLSGSSLTNHVYGLDWNAYLFKDVSLSGFAAVSTGDDPTAGAGAVRIGKSGEGTSFHAGWARTDDEFRPASGFVRRPGTQRLSGDAFLPVFVRSRGINRVGAEIDIEQYRDESGSLLDSSYRIGMRTELLSDDVIGVFVRRGFERVDSEFQIFPGSSIPAGEYESLEGGVSIITKPGRVVSSQAGLVAGQFYGGSHVAADLSLQWKISSHLSVSQAYAADRVTLPMSTFQAQLLRSRLDYSVDTHLAFSSVLQYDNATHTWGLDFRASYLFREGTELLFVLDRTANSPARTDAQTLVMAKLTYLF